MLFRSDVTSLADAIEPWLRSPERDAEVRRACIDLVERLWNPRYQCRAIERAVCGAPADDLMEGGAA